MATATAGTTLATTGAAAEATSGAAGTGALEEAEADPLEVCSDKSRHVLELVPH
jgi:hypothetical protein